jgi:hypothetical protein
VVIAVVNQHRVRAVESKCHSPIAVHPDGPVAGQLALEWVEPPAGQAHVLRARGGIELRELAPQPGSVSGLNTRPAAGAEEDFEALVSERPNHVQSV